MQHAASLRRHCVVLVLLHQAALALTLSASVSATARLEQGLEAIRRATLTAGDVGVDRLEALLPSLLASLSSGEASGAKKKQAPSCLFDDSLFSMTDAVKAELHEEFAAPVMAEAVKFVRTGGWWSCGKADMVEPFSCLCPGTVRLVDIDRTPLGTPLVVTQTGEVQCLSANFGLPAGGKWPDLTSIRGCECHAAGNSDGVSPDGYHLHKRLTSKSVLQEAWIYLTRLLGRAALLPVGTGDRTHSGVENWAARVPPGAEEHWVHGILERHWITRYIREAKDFLPGPNCLEWGDPKDPGNQLSYVHLVPNCQQNFDMQFDHSYWTQKPMAVEGNVVYSDILSLPTVLPPHLRMNTIFATQVFEHLADPLRAALALFGALAPGGAVVFTGPQWAPFHEVPHDYYRYTVEGVKYALIQAGFCVPNNVFAGGGDFVFSIAAQAGLLVQDFSMDEIEGAYQNGYEAVSHSAIGLHAIGFKPPHHVCSDPTAGKPYLDQVGIRP